MRVLFRAGKGRMALLGVALAAGAWGAAPHIQMAQESAPVMGASAGAAMQKMAAQRPLVRAAAVLQAEVDRRAYKGFTSLVIEAAGVALWWKEGRVPASLAGALAEAREIAPVRVASARYSLAELKAAAAELRAHTPPGLEIQAIKLDPTGAGLVVSVPETTDVERESMFMTQSLAGGVPVRLQAERAFRPVARDDDASPWSGGATIINRTLGAGCTSGFGVQRGSSFFVLTAAHCGNVGDRFTDAANELIGFVTERDRETLDQELIPVAASSNRMYVGNRQSNTTKVVTGWEPCFVGEMLCQSGVTSARTVGGPVCNLRVSIVHDTSLVEAVNLDNQPGARPGDSGGPVYSDQGATVIAKGTNTFVAGNRLGFHSVKDANAAFGIEISGTRNGVVFFQDRNFGGAASRPLQRGSFTRQQLEAAGLANDTASSVRVPPGFVVTLFQNNNFQGTSWRLAADTPVFRNLTPAGANDAVSSVRIE